MLLIAFITMTLFKVEMKLMRPSPRTKPRCPRTSSLPSDLQLIATAEEMTSLEQGQSSPPNGAPHGDDTEEESCTGAKVTHLRTIVL